MNTLEKKYNIKETDETKKLHRSRRMFCIYNNKLQIAPKDSSDSHATWFVKENWMTIEDDGLIKEIPRGMVKENGDVYFYVGYNFEINDHIESIFFEHFSELIKELNLNANAEVFGGLIKSNSGETWPPRKSYGKIKDIIPCPTEQSV